MKTPTNFLASVLILSPIATYATEETDEVSASSECVQEASQNYNDSFDQFSTKFSGDTTLVTAKIFEGYSLISDKQSKTAGAFDLAKPKAVGIRATSSLPATTSTKEEYADTAYLTREGGLVNLTMSLIGSPLWPAWRANSSFDECIKKAKIAGNTKSGWRRIFASDRVYLRIIDDVATEKTSPYLLNGLTLKGLKEGLEDNENDSGNKLTGAAVLYFGLGVDGAITNLVDREESANSTKNKRDYKPSAAGTFDINGGYQYAWYNRGALRRIYENEQISSDDSHGIAGFASIKVQFSDKFYLNLEHVHPLQDMKKYMGEVTTFSLGLDLGGSSN